MKNTVHHVKKQLCFYTPPQAAQKFLFYPIAAGYYECGDTYFTHRERYDSFLAIYVLDGSMSLEQSGRSFVADKGELLLVDCYQPHTYYANGHATILWVHFDGGSSRNWFEHLTQKSQMIKASTDCMDIMASVIEGIRSNRDEYFLSGLIHALLCTLSHVPAPTKNTSSSIKKAIAYMEENLEQDLTVAQIASLVHFSAPYFSKVFKGVTGSSPYSYLIDIRIKKAKKLLIQSTLPISVIASETGFQSTENFIYCFKQRNGISPLKFRSLKF